MGTPWLYSPELLPLRIRAKATAVATSFSWLCTFVVVEITPPAITNIGKFISLLQRTLLMMDPFCRLENLYYLRRSQRLFRTSHLRKHTWLLY
jgi:hypothetical protein